MPMVRMMFIMACCLVLAGQAGAQEREEKVRNDRKRVEAEGFWIYNDFARGMAEAKKSGKPLVVVLRCIPCVECVKLDDDLVDRDPRVRPLLEQFVCVRLVSTNGLDLSLFQFDYDQSFAVFFLNADGTIYGRFGTRSHRTQWSGDVSIEGLAKALHGALALHKQYPNNKDELAGKTGIPTDVPSPEKYALFRGRYESKLDYDAPVVKQCIHCHQIGDAQRQQYRERHEAIPEQVLFSYPHPKTLGLILDPHQLATVQRVDHASPAAQAGFEKGDQILKLAGQPLLSIADVQWVLQQTDVGGGDVRAEIAARRSLAGPDSDVEARLAATRRHLLAGHDVGAAAHGHRRDVAGGPLGCGAFPGRSPRNGDGAQGQAPGPISATRRSQESRLPSRRRDHRPWPSYRSHPRDRLHQHGATRVQDRPGGACRVVARGKRLVLELPMQP